MNRIIQEELFFFDEGNNEIKYINGVRKKREIIYDSSEKRNKGEKISIKTNGIYIITGGCGGLGVSFASYLANNYHAHLVLTGRRQINPDIEKILEKLDKNLKSFLI